MRREKSNYMIQSVAHALDVIEQFGGQFEELGVTELSKRLKLHKNNVFRLLATLESRGYIEQNKTTENYRLGVRCLQLGQHYLGQMGLLQQARPIMAELSRRCRETSVLSVYRSRAMVPLLAVESEQPVRIAARIGDALPLHCTAAGKTHLAFAAPEERDENLARELQRHTARTVTDRQALLRQLEAAAARGFAVDEGELVEDVHSIAVPIRDYTRSVVACLAVSGPAYRMSTEQIEKAVAPLVISAGGDLSTRLGYNAS